MEMAREAEVESLTFIKGEMIFSGCDKCPIFSSRATCARRGVFTGKSEASEIACYGAFMRFLFSEE
jgi:hypothetical protein